MVLAEFTYGHDKVGNRQYERRVHEPSGENWKGEVYAYDSVYRLRGWQEGALNAGGALQGTATATRGYTLDGLGNWTSHSSDGTSYANVTNPLNQYTTFQGTGGARTLAYDFTGNLVSQAWTDGEPLPPVSHVQNYAYDFANRLVSYVDDTDGATEYRYDALSRRISKAAGGTVYLRFVYDGSRLIEEREGNTTLVASYLYGAGSQELLSRRRWLAGSATDLFYHTNSLGSVAAVTDSTGAVVERYKYDAYGKPTFLAADFSTVLTSSAVGNSILFAGAYYDGESGNYHLWHREYDPYLGRFLQRDPLGESASLNLYAYVFNNPINAVDPTGMVSQFSDAQISGFMSDFSQALRNMDGGGKGKGSWDPFAGQRGDDRLFGRDLEGEFQDGIAKQDAAYWAGRAKAKQDKRDAELYAQKEKSEEKNQAAGITSPKGVVGIIVGHDQKVEDDATPGKGSNDLDVTAANLRKEGYLVYEFESDSMGKAFDFSEVSESGVRIVADAVEEATNNGSLSVDIVGYSRGGGGAIEVANTLESEGYDVGKVAYLDGKASAGSNTLLFGPSDISVRVYRPQYWTPVQMLAPMVGLHGSIYQTVGKQVRQIGTCCQYPSTHGGLDQYGRGALGDVENWLLGGP